MSAEVATAAITSSLAAPVTVTIVPLMGDIAATLQKEYELVTASQGNADMRHAG